MNHHSKARLLATILGVSTLAVITIAPSAGAISASPKVSELADKFCTGVATKLGDATNKVQAARDKATAAQADRATKISDNRAKWDQELAANRAKWDQQRQDNFAKLEAKATTDAQKAAVKTYEQTITDAITKRREANDAARTTFRKGVDDAVANQKSTVNAQIVIMQNAISTAVTSAEAACTSGTANAATIKTNLQTAIKNAKDTFNNARKNDGALGEKIKALAQTRNDAIKANDAAFEATAKAAREALKAAFGTQASNV